MIYIVEIPHPHLPFCWSALDEADAVNKMWQTHVKLEDTPDDDAPFAEWIRYNGLDLYMQYVFKSTMSAIYGLKEISGRGASKAIAALREELMANGELPKEVSNGH